MWMKMDRLLRYRNVWLGVAMLWIILAHSRLEIPTESFGFLKASGYGGVDICLFASGVGCYFSLEKDADGLRFLKRRLIRLGPTYLCAIVVWLAYRIIKGGFPIEAVLGNLLGIQTLTNRGNSFNWYISGLVVMYILAPYLKALADRVWHWYMQLLAVGLLLLISVVFWEANTYIIIVTRLPIFFMGMLFAQQCKCGKELKIQYILISVLVTILGFVVLYQVNRRIPEYLWSHGWYWYPFILITPGLCIILSLGTMGLEKTKIGHGFSKIVEQIGKDSFEIYLIHVPFYEFLVELTQNWKMTLLFRNLLWLTTLPIIAVACIIMKTVVKALLYFCKKSSEHFNIKGHR